MQQKVFLQLKIKSAEESQNKDDIETGKKWVIVGNIERPRKDSSISDEFTVRYKSKINIDKSDFGKVLILEVYPFARTNKNSDFSKVNYTILAIHKSIS